MSRIRDRNGGQEPNVTPLPQQQPTVTPEVQAFINSTTRQRQELQYLQSENAQLQNDLKLAHERIRMLDSELTTVRADRDFLQRHDGAMLTSLHNIKVLIDASLASARDDAYAPPGSGTNPDAIVERNAHDDARLQELAEKIVSINEAKEP